MLEGTKPKLKMVQSWEQLADGHAFMHCPAQEYQDCHQEAGAFSSSVDHPGAGYHGFQVHDDTAQDVFW